VQRARSGVGRRGAGRARGGAGWPRTGPGELVAAQHRAARGGAGPSCGGPWRRGRASVVGERKKKQGKKKRRKKIKKKLIGGPLAILRFWIRGSVLRRQFSEP
jgi:hypothetical protein